VERTKSLRVSFVILKEIAVRAKSTFHAGYRQLNQTRLLNDLFEVRQIATPSSEPPSVTCLTPCLFNGLQTFFDDSSLAANLLVTLPEIHSETDAKLRGRTLQQLRPPSKLLPARRADFQGYFFPAQVQLRFSVGGFHLTNNFNPLDVHANLSDPLNGMFFVNYVPSFADRKT
jgi:hypothetical protein